MVSLWEHRPPQLRRFEAKDAIANGADEIDMVINIGALKSNDLDFVYNDIKALVDVTRNKALLKSYFRNLSIN